MEFYRLLSKHYDEIFPAKPAQIGFISNYLTLNQLSSILDVGCATGSYALALSNSGFQVMGVDLSQEMIELALSRSQIAKSSATFAIADMQDLSSIPTKFDAVMCIGNTLAHLRSESEVSQALRQFSTRGQHLIIQLVNYDRIIAEQITKLPEIRTEHLVFKRNYSARPDGLIDFSMEIELQDGSRLGAVNTLFPLTRASLDGCLQSAGWKATGWYGSFGGEGWQLNSPATIITAQFIGELHA